MRLSLLLVVPFFLSCPSLSPAQALDAIVARVDQAVVTWSQVLQEHALRDGVGGEAPRGLEPGPLVEELIRRHLFAAEARKLRLEVGADEVGADVDALVGARGGAERFWGDAARWGLTEQDVRTRARQLLLVKRYLSLRLDMTYVPEADVRAYHEARQGSVFRGRSLPEAREEIRALLVRRKHEQDLEQWVVDQVTAGRVRRFSVPVALPLGS